MNAIKAIVRNGRLETDEPIGLPEGTELMIPIPEIDFAEDNSVSGIAAWLDWYETVKPLNIAAAEERDADAWLKQCDSHGAANLNEAVDGLFR